MYFLAFNVFPPSAEICYIVGLEDLRTVQS